MIISFQKIIFFIHVKLDSHKSKKEVIQPQVPLRLPCDDLPRLTELRFDSPKLNEPHQNPARME